MNARVYALHVNQVDCCNFTYSGSRFKVKSPGLNHCPYSFLARDTKSDVRSVQCQSISKHHNIVITFVECSKIFSTKAPVYSNVKTNTFVKRHTIKKTRACHVITREYQFDRFTDCYKLLFCFPPKFEYKNPSVFFFLRRKRLLQFRLCFTSKVVYITIREFFNKTVSNIFNT